MCWDTEGHLVVLSDSNVLTVTSMTGQSLTSVKLQQQYNGMTVIGKCVLLFDTYCVTKLIWKHNERKSHEK